MSEEFRLLLQMKRTTKLILLVIGIVTGSCILQLAIVVSNFTPESVHQYVEEQRFVSTDTLWAVFKPAIAPETADSNLQRQTEN